MNDNYLYAKIAKFVVNRSDLAEKDKAKEIVEAAKASMGNKTYTTGFPIIVVVISLC